MWRLKKEIICPICKEKIHAPSAEELAFNSQGACLKCGGTGIVRTVDIDSLVPDKTLTIDEGAVVPWNSLMWTLMTDVCRAMGVRTDVPFNQLTDEEKILFIMDRRKRNIFFIRLKIQIMQEKWILLILMQLITVRKCFIKS